MEYKDLKDQACRYVDELKPVIYGIAESLHDHPEQKSVAWQISFRSPWVSCQIPD